MVKIVHIKNIFFKIHRYARSLGIENLVLQDADDGYYIGIGDTVFRTQSLPDLTKLIFGPIKPSQVKSISSGSSWK